MARKNNDIVEVSVDRETGVIEVEFADYINENTDIYYITQVDWREHKDADDNYRLSDISFVSGIFGFERRDRAWLKEFIGDDRLRQIEHLQFERLASA